MSDRFIPAGFEVPRSFEGTRFHLEPLGPEHNLRDHEAWMSSIDHIQTTPGMENWGWPVPMTLDENLADLELHAREFSVRKSFAYSVLDGDEVIGCVYIDPTDDPDHEAHVRSWVTASRAEMDAVVWREVSDWLEGEWPFRSFSYAPRPADSP